MDRLAAMVKLLDRPDMVDQHRRLAEERRAKAKLANDLYHDRHGAAKRSAQSRNHTSAYQDRLIRQRFLGQPCQRCGGNQALEVCHIIPVECGRDDTPANILWLCHDCHQIAHGIMANYELQSCWDLT